MTLYCAGWQATHNQNENRIIDSGYITHRCFSFANLGHIEGLPYHRPKVKEGYLVCVKRGIGIMMDSGVFSYRKFKKQHIRAGKTHIADAMASEDTFIKVYTKWCKRYHKLWDFYVTVDLYKEDAKNYLLHKQLLKNGIRPIPVVRALDGGCEYIKKYANLGHDRICIGVNTAGRHVTRTIRCYLDNMFNEAEKLNVKYHGLAVTAPWIMIDFPWYSVDSSSWTRAAGYGCLLKFSPVTHRISTLHVSDRMSAKSVAGTAALEEVKEMVESEGFNWGQLQTDYVSRHIYNARTMQEIVKFATKNQRQEWKILV